MRTFSDDDMWSTEHVSSRNASDDFDDFYLPLPPCDNEQKCTLHPAEIIAQARADLAAEEFIRAKLDNYVEVYVRPALQINIHARSTSSGFIPDDIIQYEYKFAKKLSVDKAGRKKHKWSCFACSHPQVRY
jgi:hypothetical protein